jgi:hypothetical protein
MSRIDPLNTNIASAALPAANRDAVNGGDFARAFGEAMTRSLSENALAASGGAAALPPGDSLGYLQSMLLTGAAEGQTDSGEMLLYMLMAMMQEFKNSDLAPLITAMQALMPSSGPGASGVPGASGSYKSAAIPEQAWLPTAFQDVSTTGRRSAGALNKVISQFNVESASRYRPWRNGNTYCNIFVWDVTRALGCEIPHYVERESGDARYYPDVKGAYELDANATCDWLKRRGADYGWREITAAEAQQYANAGYPVVSAWRNNGGGAGHVQIVCPSRGGGYDSARGVTVAQAGNRNFSYAHINATMSADKIAQTRYYAHN